MRHGWQVMIDNKEKMRDDNKGMKDLTMKYDSSKFKISLLPKFDQDYRLGFLFFGPFICKILIP